MVKIKGNDGCDSVGVLGTCLWELTKVFYSLRSQRGNK